MSKSIVRFLGSNQLGDVHAFFALLNGLPSCNVAMDKKKHRTAWAITIHRSDVKQPEQCTSQFFMIHPLSWVCSINSPLFTIDQPSE
jgi:hypothetical protein